MDVEPTTPIPPLTLSEIKVLEAAVAVDLLQWERNLKVARSTEVRDTLRTRLMILNSLRTMLAEARYSLEMPPGQ